MAIGDAFVDEEDLMEGLNEARGEKERPRMSNRYRKARHMWRAG